MTDSEKHTPGPWVVADSNSYRRIVRADRYEPVCCPVTQRDGHPDLQFPNGGYKGPDARLIAAAPDLYGELRHLVRLLEPLERDGQLDVSGLATLNGARAALTKAESREGCDHE
jgi:hypothetical protein